ncbi:Putative Ribonuclease/ribotoxin [[Torrubiella] hemipterigena]|uniref:ribonuclease T1 n=1 Tax=[Torrubiella] hemipterigena TaxID=1531966 RepID=A0A0A1SRZ5_9HYPO|nr:Putative Ribonuclease/ribotoxin [[Torrubiella] hemipterigena]
MQFSITALFSVLAVVSAAPAELERRAAATCGSTHYSAGAVDSASQASCQHVQNGDTAGSSTYPHKYNNYEGFNFNGVSGPYYEFPILSSGKIYNGGKPGADRVIINANCEEAGVITHQGASGNNFVACSGTN